MFLGSRASFEELYRELLATKEAKAEVERSRDEAVSRARELELKYQDLLLEVKQLNVTDTNRLAELECQLKMKTYELDRCSILLAEMEAKYKHVTSLKENLERKLEQVKEELAMYKMNSEKTICALKLQLQEKTVKLNGYEKLETELDKMIMRAAQQSDPDEAERILAMCEKEAFIPLNSKHRLQQSLQLARRVLELENQYSELKEDIFRERDLKQDLQRELTATKAALTLTSRPTSELIQVILKRNLEIQRLQAKISTLEQDILQLKETEHSLRHQLQKYSNQEAEFQVLKQMISELRPPPQDYYPESPRRREKTKSAAKITSSKSVLTPEAKLPSHHRLPPEQNHIIHIKKPLSFTKLSQASLEKRFKNFLAD